jgi:Na+-driven multidrug efflux pump
MDILSSSLRGMKYSISIMLISLTCAVPFRILWVYLVFPYEPFNTANWLMASFPISWVIGIIPFSVMITIAFKKLKKKFGVNDALANTLKKENT